MAMNQSCYALTGLNWTNQFFVHQLTLYIIEKLKHKANGAVFDAIVTRDFDSEIIVIPPIETVGNFGQQVQTLYEKIRLNSLENQKLIAIRDTLLPKLMNGEIEV